MRVVDSVEVVGTLWVVDCVSWMYDSDADRDDLVWSEVAPTW